MELEASPETIPERRDEDEDEVEDEGEAALAAREEEVLDCVISDSHDGEGELLT